MQAERTSVQGDKDKSRYCLGKQFRQMSGIMHLTNNRLKASADFADERRFNSFICGNLRHLRIKIRIVCELHNPTKGGSMA